MLILLGLVPLFQPQSSTLISFTGILYNLLLNNDATTDTPHAKKFGDQWIDFSLFF